MTVSVWAVDAHEEEQPPSLQETLAETPSSIIVKARPCSLPPVKTPRSIRMGANHCIVMLL